MDASGSIRLRNTTLLFVAHESYGRPIASFAMRSDPMRFEWHLGRLKFEIIISIRSLSQLTLIRSHSLSFPPTEWFHCVRRRNDDNSSGNRVGGGGGGGGGRAAAKCKRMAPAVVAIVAELALQLNSARPVIDSGVQFCSAVLFSSSVT